jgi:hypothetical protein
MVGQAVPGNVFFFETPEGVRMVGWSREPYEKLRDFNGHNPMRWDQAVPTIEEAVEKYMNKTDISAVERQKIKQAFWRLVKG